MTGVLLIAAGMPVTTAFVLGMAVGCLSMVLMMVTGGHRRHHHMRGDGTGKLTPPRDDPFRTVRSRR